MRIGIDISTILNHGINVGSGRYIYNLLNSILSIHQQIVNGNFNNSDGNNFANNFRDIVNNNNKFSNLNNNINDINYDLNNNFYNFIKNLSFIFTGWYKSSENLELIDKLKEKFPNAKIKLIFFKLTEQQFEKWNKKNFPPIEFKGFKADIFHCPDYLILPTLNKNIVLTIHDLSFYRFPEYNFDWFIKKYQQLVLKNANKAKKIIADSMSTKEDIINFMKISENKINVVYLAADEKFNINENEKNIKKESSTKLKEFQEIQKRVHINKKYILSVGTIEPRKNFKTLIKAFNIFKENFPISKDYSLVIVGKTGWKSEETYEEYNKSPFKEDIIFTGNIDDDQLFLLYQNASLFVYPTIFEGFGLPLLEAMSCGLPIIATNTSSIPEIYSNQNDLLNPLDEKAMANKINNVLTNENLKNQMINFSLQQAKKFSWIKTAFQTLKVYYSCIYNNS